MRRLALSLAILAFSPAVAKAQSDSVLTNALTDTSSLLGRLAMDSEREPPVKLQVGSIRLASASGGFMFGMLFGGFAGHELQDESCTSNCRATTGESLLTGAAIGGAAGAALGAAFLNLRSVCTFHRRLTRTVVGTAIGASAFFAAAGGMEKRRGSSAFFIPIGAIGGSLGTLGPCWKSRF